MFDIPHRVQGEGIKIKITNKNIKKKKKTIEKLKILPTIKKYFSTFEKKLLETFFFSIEIGVYDSPCFFYKLNICIDLNIENAKSKQRYGKTCRFLWCIFII